MRIRIIVVLLLAAILLGIASWYMVSPTPDMPRLVYLWFYGLAGLVDYWIWPESNFGFMVMSMTVYTVQFILLFALVASIVPAAHLIRDFLRPHKHRTGLLDS